MVEKLLERKSVLKELKPETFADLKAAFSNRKISEMIKAAHMNLVPSPKKFPSKEEVEKLNDLMGKDYVKGESGYGNRLLDKMVRYNEAMENGTFRSVVSKKLIKDYKLPKEIVDQFLQKIESDQTLYDLLVFTDINNSYAQGHSLSNFPESFGNAMMAMVEKIVNENANPLEAIPLFVLKSLDLMKDLNILEYGKMAINIPKIIGILKCDDTSWYEIKFARISDYYNRGDWYF